MRQLIGKIKERSDKLNDLLTCESIDNEQIAEEAKAAYYDVVCKIRLKTRIKMQLLTCLFMR